MMKNPVFAATFADAVARIRDIEFRFVGETDPTRQCLIEINVSVVGGSSYSDFNTTWQHRIRCRTAQACAVEDKTGGISRLTASACTEATVTGNRSENRAYTAYV